MMLEMINIWICVLLSSFFISLIALIGIVLFPVKREKLGKVLIYFISFSTGALFGGAFFHLLPEVVEESGFTFMVSSLLLGGIILFFIMLILVFIFQKKEKKMLVNYVLIILVFSIILLPVISLRTQGGEDDLLLSRIMGVAAEILSE